MDVRASLRGAGSKLAWFVAASLLAGGCDLSSKAWAERTLTQAPDHTLAVFEPWLDLALAYNRGMGFSLVVDLGAARWIFGLMALVVVVVLAVMVVRQRPDRLDLVAMASIAGGALGNGFDRVFRAAPGGGTGVIDFVKVNYPWGGHWPLFNVADALLVVGVAVLMLRRLRRPESPPDAAAPA